MSLRLFHILLLVAIAPATMLSQIVVDSARGLVGKEVALAMRASGALDSMARLSIRGSFHLSNATVFYPERFIAGGLTRVDDYSLTRLTDSTYDFTVDISIEGSAIGEGDTLCLLAGEALVGYDSVCVVTFSPLRANDAPVDAAAGVVVTRSIGTPLPYVRYATLEPGYPNPAQRYQTVTWGFRIDKASEVSFAIYNLAGELLSNHDMGLLGPGIYTKTFNIGFDVATGVYLVTLHTNSGDASQWMHVTK